ncbi:MAG: Ca2+-dependent phosphoinositide-specific phospholipase C [Candidatus Thalassarchaeaceae archaeon]|jgi:hypothetical protein|nr:Ca2+-dependent phosphoinositide-specific phospholipase C [Candidatus Thalassarchaeaceae archaeon]
MRVAALLLAYLMAASSMPGCLGIGEGGGLFGDDEPDAQLRMNHIQMKGTHNSYHIEPLVSPTREYMYTHEPLDLQASQLGVRQFEIDVWWDVREGLRVYHNQYDSGTTCPTFENCLSTLLSWSEDNPGHHPLFIWIEPKDWPEQAADVTTTLELSGLLDDIEQEIAEFWPRNKTIAPDDVRGQRDTLREAVLEDGWPMLEASRGKAVFVLLATGETRDLYVEDHPGLFGALMFTLSGETSDEAAIFSLTDPKGDGDEITRLVSEGYIVRSRADSGGEEADDNDTSRLEAALASGAHSISTDYPGPVDGLDYWVDIPNGTPSRCNPVTAPDGCSSGDLESI